MCFDHCLRRPPPRYRPDQEVARPRARGPAGPVPRPRVPKSGPGPDLPVLAVAVRAGRGRRRSRSGDRRPRLPRTLTRADGSGLIVPHVLQQVAYPRGSPGLRGVSIHGLFGWGFGVPADLVGAADLVIALDVMTGVEVLVYGEVRLFPIEFGDATAVLQVLA